MSQSSQILSLLRQRGLDGVDQTELNAIAYRYSARIHELRRRGHKILTIMLRPNIAKFIYVEGN